jgi:hypothetical protein
MLIDAEDALSPVKIGYAYAKANKSNWIKLNNDVVSEITVGTTKGADYVIYNDKVYMIVKVYFLIEDNEKLVVCKECIDGCETKVF